MRTKKIRQIIKAFERSSLENLEITKGKMKISMQKPIGTAHLLNSQNSTIERLPSSESNWIRSPLVGTFYIKMTHESEPLITLGKHVKKNEVVCIIETMKVFNEIRSPLDGVITKIEIEDGCMVEYHQPIILINCDD